MIQLAFGTMLVEAADEQLLRLAGDGAVMLRTPDGDDLISVNPHRPLVPASVLKIPMAHVALTSLGEDYRFATLFYRNAQGDLLIRGLGDPFLVSEEIAEISSRLAQQGLQSVRRLVMDDSAFEPNPDLPLESGVRDPYGARNGALAVNFNTVNLAWNDNNELISGEEQTPLTPLARELSRDLRPGSPERINVGSDPIAGLRQAQQLFHIFLERSGVKISDSGFYQQPVSADWTLLYRHASSRSLTETIDGLLRYSNNFIANQLFLTVGAQQQGYPATAEAARQVLHQRLASLYGEGFGTDPGLLLMNEGSGLDRRQRSTASALLRILEGFRPFANLLPEEDGVLRKSGTLTGVYNYAGYIRGQDGLYPFVILTNQARNHRNEILQRLQRQVAARND